ncbi:RNA polymerase I-specific transcription initiation factor RRN3-domain-containing protein [Suillus occidentalis]|nr:RNA polymerase I-specific transcription initiation factor RRN3-domain-containing protein [Suillus occidentalis]
MDLHSRHSQFNQRAPKNGPFSPSVRFEPTQKVTLDKPYARSSMGHSKEFDDLVDQFSPNKSTLAPIIPSLQLRIWLLALMHVLSRLKRPLVEAIVRLPWSSIDAVFVKSYTEFIGMLISARPEYLLLVLNRIAMGFTYQFGLLAVTSNFEGSTPLTRRVIYDRQHALLEHLLNLVPTLPSSLAPLLRRTFRESPVDWALRVDVEIQVELEELKDAEPTLDSMFVPRSPLAKRPLSLYGIYLGLRNALGYPRACFAVLFSKMYPELITRPDIKVFLPPIGNLTCWFSYPGFFLPLWIFHCCQTESLPTQRSTLDSSSCRPGHSHSLHRIYIQPCMPNSCARRPDSGVLCSASSSSARLPRKRKPSDKRNEHVQLPSIGYTHPILKWQNQQGRSQDNSRQDKEIGFLGRLQRQKVDISRRHILESAVKVFELYGSSSSILEEEYFDEVGTGLGPTLEFYSLVSKEFAITPLASRPVSPALTATSIVYELDEIVPPLKTASSPPPSEHAHWLILLILLLLVCWDTPEAAATKKTGENVHAAKAAKEVGDETDPPGLGDGEADREGDEKHGEDVPDGGRVVRQRGVAESGDNADISSVRGGPEQKEENVKRQTVVIINRRSGLGEANRKRNEGNGLEGRAARGEKRESVTAKKKTVQVYNCTYKPMDARKSSST